jgi:Tlde1 domain
LLGRTFCPEPSAVRTDGVGEVVVRAGMRSIFAGVVALAMGFAVKSGGTPAAPVDAGVSVERPGISVFRTIHPDIFNLRPPVGSQIRATPGVRVASLEAEVDAAAVDEETHATAATSTTQHISFHERFASSFARLEDEDQSVVFGAPVWPVPLAAAVPGPPLGTFASPAQLRAKAVLPPDPTVSKKPVRIAVTRSDSILRPDSDSRTAIYDIAAHAVYLPNGKRLEAHSGLGRHLDDPRSVNLNGRGPTPPNVYDLVLREQLFHGVRAIRLNPVGEGKMYGRDGMLAHSYMLGPNGQSNGCVSFSNYPAFLNAFLRGEVDRLVVVERLATAPTRRAGL